MDAEPPPIPPDTQERRDGPTPHGGAYVVLYYRDRHGFPCPKEDAARVETVEYAVDGRAIHATRQPITDP